MRSVAIITGGARGLGRALVEKWLAEDWAVATCARSEREIESLKRDLGAHSLVAEALDVSKQREVSAFVRRVHEQLGPTDVLINNAGLLGPRAPLETYPEQEWRAVIDVNLNGSFYFTKAVLPEMLERRSGVIINISSGAGVKGKARWGAYAASKFAVEGMTQVLREEVQDRGVRVHAIDPGAMRTEMRAHAYPEEDPLTLPEPKTVANVIFDISVVYEPQLCRLTVKEYM